MKEVTDVAILEELQAPEAERPQRREVTDPAILAQLGARPGPAERTGGAGILSDILASAQATPRALVEFARQLPSEGAGALRQLTQTPGRAALKAAAGVGEGARGLVNIPYQIAQYLKRKDIPYFRELADYYPHIPTDLGIEEALGIGEEESGDVLLKGLSAFVPAGQVGLIGRGLGPGRNILGAMLAQAGMGEDPIPAALTGAGGAAVGGAARRIKAPGISSVLKSPLSPEELTERSRIAQDTRTNLADIIQDAKLKKTYENIISEAPGAIATQVEQQTAKEITKLGESLMESLGGKSIDKDAGTALLDALKETQRDIRKTKNQKYDETWRIAEEENVQMGRDNLSARASEILEEVRGEPELLRKLPKSFIDDLTYYSDPKRTAKGKTSNILKGLLREEEQAMRKEGADFIAGKYADLRNALRDDINSAIELSGNEKLKKSYADAEKYYGENYAPLNSRELSKYLREGADADTLLGYFLRTGRKTDRANLLKQLLDNIPENQKDLAASSYFNNAIKEGQLNPQAFSTLYRQLGERQRKVLLGDKADQFSDYSALVGMNTESLNAMANPMTGARLTKGVPLVTAGGAGYALGGPVGMFALPLALGAGSRQLTKLMTEPASRNKILSRLIKEKQKEAQKKAKKPIVPRGMSGAVIEETEFSEENN